MKFKIKIKNRRFYRTVICVVIAAISIVLLFDSSLTGIVLFLLCLAYFAIRKKLPTVVTFDGGYMKMRFLIFTRKLSLDRVENIRFGLFIVQNHKKSGSRWIYVTEYRVCAEIGYNSGKKHKLLRLNDDTGIITKEKTDFAMAPDIEPESTALYALCRELSGETGIEPEMMPDKMKMI